MVLMENIINDAKKQIKEFRRFRFLEISPYVLLKLSIPYQMTKQVGRPNRFSK